MCLFPFGGYDPNQSMCDQCCGETVQPSTQKAAYYIQILKVLLIFQIVLAAMQFFSFQQDAFSVALMQMMICVVLYQFYNSVNYCCGIYYVFTCLYMIIMSGAAIGFRLQQVLQDKIPSFFKDQPIVVYAIILSMLTFIFYSISIYFSFLAYREFKASMGGMNQGFLSSFQNLGGGGGQQVGRGGYQDIEQQRFDSPNNQNRYGAVDDVQYQQQQQQQRQQQQQQQQTQQQQQQYQQQQQSYVRQQPQQQSSGGQKYFQGKGTRIG